MNSSKVLSKNFFENFNLDKELLLSFFPLNERKAILIDIDKDKINIKNFLFSKRVYLDNISFYHDETNKTSLLINHSDEEFNYFFITDFVENNINLESLYSNKVSMIRVENILKIYNLNDFINYITIKNGNIFLTNDEMLKKYNLNFFNLVKIINKGIFNLLDEESNLIDSNLDRVIKEFYK